MDSQYYKKMRRSEIRQRRREQYRRMHEDQLLDEAFRGPTKEKKQQDQQIAFLQEWLSKQLQ